MTTTATCYCGSVQLELPEAPTHATQCTCSWCTKSGGLWAYYAPEAVRIVKAEHLARFAPNPLHEHFFCANCGCTTHGVSPEYTMESLTSNEIPEKRKLAINLKILDDYELVQSLPIQVIDGRNLW